VSFWSGVLLLVTSAVSLTRREFSRTRAPQFTELRD